VTGSDVLDSHVVISDTVPDGLTYVPGSISGGDGRDDSGAPTLTWTVNDLPPRTPVGVTFAATATEKASPAKVIVNRAALTSQETEGTTEASNSVTVEGEVPVGGYTRALTRRPALAVIGVVLVTLSAAAAVGAGVRRRREH
jgi:hypothetical protein